MRYAELLQKLETALVFCENLGLGDRVEASRFKEYRTLIISLCSIIDSYSFDSLPAGIKKELTDRNFEYVLSLTESVELVETMDYLKTCDKEIARVKLANILGGPLLPKDEDKNSNEARNTLFEVSLASKIWSAGLKPSLGRLADIEIEVAGKLLLIECKRPFREKRIKRRMKEARKQIDGWVKDRPPGSRGVIAVSVTKVLNPGDKILPYRDVSSAKATLSRLLEQLANRNKKSLQSLGKNIIGVLFHVITPSIDEKQYSLGEQFNTHPLAKPGSADESALEALFDALNRLEH